MTKTTVAIIGAGPAGLTSAYLLAKRNIAATVIEADPVYVGGISRTVNYKGFHFDIGGHRFFSKSKEVEALWQELLPNDLLDRPRSSRIYYGGKFFSYPLKAFEALTKLGFWKSFICVCSWLKAQWFPVKNPDNFEDWVSNQFGKKLFSIFFKSYTEKVWGMDCKDISADWAAQRIKGLSLGTAIKNALFPKQQAPSGDKGGVIKTLINSFKYPRKGPGMMWEAAAEKFQAMGGQILMGRKVVGCQFDAARKVWQVTYEDAAKERTVIEANHVISSAPLRELVRGISPAASEPARQAAAALKYRDFLTVALVLKDREIFSDNWIYIHEPKVKVGRIQNFKSWSPELVPDPSLCCYGLEYFCFEGDGLWTSSDADLIALARRELAEVGLAAEVDVLDGCVVRQPKAYPVYDDDYAKNVATVRDEIAAHFPGLHCVGRNGMHKYNNQDHAMMTAMLCVENIAAGEQVYDLWSVNEDAEYHEDGGAGEQSGASGLRAVPTRVGSASPKDLAVVEG